ncbi:MAG: phytanoyl-CoA dioxygenase family protein [Planctomycetes bacterium]|nr:phytanoyl-CoA dioxygenase family protein [Planctomycetota bacterium]
MSVNMETRFNDLMTKDIAEQYWEQGYAVVSNVFSAEEMDALATACDRWKWVASLHEKTWRKGNTVMWIDARDEENDEALLRGMQWPSYDDEVFDSFRTDQRLLQIMEPLIGNNLKQIINQVHWKKPGSKTSWALHRDVRSRKPNSAFRDLACSWVQSAIAIDPSTKENGAMQLVPGSHKDCSQNPYDHDGIGFYPEYEDDPRKIDLVMNPGDVGLWNAFTVHGGGLNTTTNMDRRININGFVKAENCDRGELIWDHGKLSPLSRNPQSLIQYDGIHDNPHAHYPGDGTEIIRD